LVEIGKAENLKPTEEEIEKEAEHLLSHYPEANAHAIRTYVANTLHHQKVLEFLEQQ
jgi:FKBP-type peptidyl-prolyl cis-trans isomerase (trigger factor)